MLLRAGPYAYMSKKIIIIVAILIVMLGLGFWLAQRGFERVERPIEEEEISILDEIEQIQPTVIDQQIGEYLADYYGQTNFGGRTYCEYELFGVEAKDQEIVYYLWAFCQEYYIDQNNELQAGMALGGPVALTARIVDGQLTFLSHRAFEDDYEAAKEVFPEIYHHRLEEDAARDMRFALAARSQAEYELLPGLGK